MGKSETSPSTTSLTGTNHYTRDLAAVLGKDDYQLAELGYKAELRRTFGSIQVFGIAFSIMSLVPSIASTISFQLLLGPVGMTWGWLSASFCIMMASTAIAELGSSMATSGGLYYWTYKFAHPKLKEPLCYLVGYANTMALAAGCASIDHGFAGILLSIPSLATNGDYQSNKYQKYGVFAACVLSHVVFASMGTKQITKFQSLSIILNIATVLIVVIALPIGARNHLNSAKFVFTSVQNQTNWPAGWTFFLTWLSPMWTMGAFDSCVHMSEEASNASYAVPFGILLSTGLCSVGGFLVNSIFAAIMNQDTTVVLDSLYGQPVADIAMRAVNKEFAIFLMCLLSILQWMMGLSVVTAGSRQAFAFARDGGLPFSDFFRQVNYKLGIPLRAVWLICVVGLLLGLITLANETAANAVFSLGTGSIYLSFLVPIAMRVIFHDEDFKPGIFYLGRPLSKAVSIFAMVYLTFALGVISMFPVGGPNPTPNDMNYTCLINGAIWIGCLIYYYLFAKRWFHGPKHTIDFYDLDMVVMRDAEEVGPTRFKEQ